MGADDNDSVFARLSRHGLESRMHEQLDELIAGRDRMAMLLQVVTGITADLDLQATLRRIITAAIQLTGARYGALGVRAADGGLASFLHEGMDAELVARIGHLPVGKGMLGALLDRVDPLRLDDLTSHPAAVGFPEHHPPMRAFLGVPISIRGAVFGSLYVTDDRPGHRFSESDEIATQALASAAAAAIDNAQLFENVQALARWTQASREIMTALLSETEPPIRPLQLIAERARELADAEQVIVLLPSDPDQEPADNDTLTVATAVGLDAEAVLGQDVPVTGSTTGQVFRSGTAIMADSFRYPIESFTDIGDRAAIVLPLRTADGVVGVIAVARHVDQPRFDNAQLKLMDDFAHHAALALTVSEARRRAQEFTVLADRDRIARDLHDHVIQRLFAAGMDLQGAAARARPPEVSQRLARIVDDLQATVDDIRTTIFNLQTSAATKPDFRARIQAVIAEITDNRDIHTTVRIEGPMTAVGPSLAGTAEAVLIEAISNTVRHSGATRLTVTVTVDDDVIIDVLDNGHGIPADNQRHSGLANMTDRAVQAGGTCQISSPPTGGTHLRWTAPLP